MSIKQNEVKKLLDARNLIDTYRQNCVDIDADKLHENLKFIGFESFESFFVFNEEACKQEIIDCYEVVGVCDNCAGRDRGCNQKCYEDRTTAISNSRVEPNKGEVGVEDTIDWHQFPNFAPPGCSIGRFKVKEPRFDVWWGMREGISQETYNKWMVR